MLLMPQYGKASLADVLPAALAALGVAGERDRIGLELDGVRRVCVLLIDGLGAQLLDANPVPFLSSCTGPVLTAGFPSTTATSLCSLGTGTPAGEHGMVGYLMALPGHDRVVNTLAWRLHGPGPKIDLLREEVPEQLQPVATAFERAAADGITVTRLGPRDQEKSGLSRAGLRGGTFAATHSPGDLAASAVEALQGERTLVYAYYGALDLTGHVRGPSSQAWAWELAHVDQLVAQIAGSLPADAALLVTADHGMVDVESTVDIDATPELQDGVRLIGGEPRMRHVYTQDGAAEDVLAAWRARLGADFAVLSRAAAVEAGLFGPRVRAAVVPWIGDVLALARAGSVLVRRGAEPMQSRLLGHHGSLTPAELLVPLKVIRS